MNTTVKTLGMVLTCLAIIIFVISVYVFGAFYRSASPLNFMIYVAVTLAFVWLGVIVYLSLGRNGEPS